jgi:hypothetical protein
LNPDISAAEAAQLHMIMLHRTDQPSDVAASQRKATSSTLFTSAASAAQRDRLSEHYWEHGWAVEEEVFSGVEVDYLLDECMRAAARDTQETMEGLADPNEEVRLSMGVD